MFTWKAVGESVLSFDVEHNPSEGNSTNPIAGIFSNLIRPAS